MGDGDSQSRRQSQLGTVKGKWTANSMIGEQKPWFLLVHALLSALASQSAGAGCGLVASIATCPLDVIKTKLQAQRAIQGQQGYLGVIGGVNYRLISRFGFMISK